MVTTTSFKDTIDLPKWRYLATGPLQGTVLNRCSTCDFRNNIDKNPFNYDAQSTTGFAAYNTKYDGWSSLPSTALTSGIIAMFFMSAQGPRGTIAAGATTTSIPLTTVLPASVGPNQLANRGDGQGFKIRIIGNSAGSSGKTEERYVIANSGPSTTPTLILDSPLSFIPANGDSYEFLSGRIFLLGASNAAGNWKYYDVLTNSMSGNLSTVNLPVSIGAANLVGLDELLVPYDRSPGEGFFGNLIATASGATSITGLAAGGDAGVVINQYRNFQVRIIQDTAIPTSVGQRRNITSHTAGASPVYTIPAWAVQPSATATYVIENNGDRIIAWVEGTTQTSTYTISGNAWDANITFAARLIAPNNMSSVQAFSIEPDIGLNARHSFIYTSRNNIALDLFDIAGATTGTWTGAITFGNSGSFPFGNQGHTHDPATNQGRYMYLFTGQMYRFDMKNRVLEPYTLFRPPAGGVNRVSTTMSYALFIDGSTKISTIINSTVSNQFGNTFPSIVYGLTIIR